MRNLAESTDEQIRGVLVSELRPDSVAQKAGLQKGDVIIEYDGVRELTTERLAGLTSSTRTEATKIPVFFVRDGCKHSVTLFSGSLGISAMDTEIREPFGVSRSNPETSPYDGPLFVLKYRPSRVFLRAFCLSFGVLLFGVFAYFVTLVAPANDKHRFTFTLFSIILFNLLFFLAMFRLMDLLLFKEIRLYRDRIVKVWKGIGERAIRLADARLSSNFRGGLRAKVICHQDTSWLGAIAKGANYNEELADPKDVLNLNSLLAELSGRKVEEFEETTRLKTFVRDQNDVFQSSCPSRWKTNPIIAAAHRTLTRILRPVRDTDQPIASYIWRAWLIAFLPSLAISAFVALATSLPGPKAPPPGQTGMFWVAAVLVLSPWLETLMMWPILAMLKKDSQEFLRTAFISALIWAFIHSLFALGWGFVIFWPFFVFSLCFLEWEKKSKVTAIVVTALVHMCQNAVPVALALLAGLAGLRT